MATTRQRLRRRPPYERDDSPAPLPKVSLQEFLVEFLGGLVPGVLFLGAAFVAITPPVHALGVALAGEQPTLLETTKTLLEAVQNTPSTLWLMATLAAATVAYIVGHQFSRRDVKAVDRVSFRRLVKQIQLDSLRREWTDEHGSWRLAGSRLRFMRAKCFAASRERYAQAVTDLNLPETAAEDLGCSSEEECEFPYLYYDRYLKKRGHSHLLPFVTWKEQRIWRSKTHLNLLKIRLRYHAPESVGDVVRNEAHIRLAASTWYVSRVLRWCGGFGCVVAVGAIGASLRFGQFGDWRTAAAWHAPALIAPLTVLFFSLYSMRLIPKFLHYQRLREIFFVLETAYTAFNGRWHLLDPPFSATELRRKPITRDDVVV